MPIPLIVAGVAAGATAYGAHKQSSSADTAAKMQTDSANRAALIEQQSQREALAFAKSQEASRRAEFQQVQDRNYGLYQEQQERLRPYRQFGGASIGQLARPIPGVGTIGSMIGGR